MCVDRRDSDGSFAESATNKLHQACKVGHQQGMQRKHACYIHEYAFFFVDMVIDVKLIKFE